MDGHLYFPSTFFRSHGRKISPSLAVGRLTCGRTSLVLRSNVQQWVQTTRYRQNVMIISNGWRMPSSAEPHGRTESTARDEQPMGGIQSVMDEEKMNIWRHQYELAMTQIYFVGGSGIPWWNWEVIQRKSWKINQCLVKNRQTSVFTTFEQGQLQMLP